MVERGLLKMSKIHNKNDLKKVILETAIEMFNQNGYSTVTVRDIAKRLNISPGNITYHYKKKQDLIEAIFELQYNDYLEMGLNADVDVEGLNILFSKVIKHQQRYFFYFNNVIEIPRCYPDLADMQKRITDNFLNLYKDILASFQKQKIMRPELNPGAYNDIAFGILSITLFWTEQKSLNTSLTKERIIQILWNNIIPSFTEKGLEMYRRL